MMPARFRRAALALIAVVAMTAGCSHAKETKVTQDEAVALVDQRAQEAFHQLPPGATLKRGLHIPDVECDDRSSSTFVETRYEVLFPEDWPLTQSMTDLVNYWTTHGYRIVRDDRQKSVPQIVVEKPDDRFRVGYLANPNPGGKAIAQIISSSPCLG